MLIRDAIELRFFVCALGSFRVFHVSSVRLGRCISYDDGGSFEVDVESQFECRYDAVCNVLIMDAIELSFLSALSVPFAFSMFRPLGWGDAFHTTMVVPLR